MTPEQKIIISLAMEVARDESFKSETTFSDEELSARAAEITADAFTENPQTEVAIEIVKKAKQIILDHENGVESPYFPKPEFDMNKFYGSVVNISIKPVLEMISKYSDILGRQLEKPTQESDDTKKKAIDEMAYGVFNILNENKVPLIWYAAMFQDIKDIFADLETVMKEQVKGRIKEITSRSVGARHPNPKKNFFNSDFATFAELQEATKKVKEQTGNDDKDYSQEIISFE